MSELDRGEPLDLDELERQVSEVQPKVIAELLERVHQMSSGQGPFNQMFGEHLFGSPTKQITDQSGNITQVPWTTEDIVHGMRRSVMEGEEGLRDSMYTEVMFALASQQSFFLRHRQHPKFRLAMECINLGSVLVERIMAADALIGESFPIEADEAIFEGDVLEAIRRTVLRPSYIICGDRAGNLRGLWHSWDEDRFWEVSDERSKQIRDGLSQQGKNPDAYPDYRRAQKEQLFDVEFCGDKDWDLFVQAEGALLKEYLEECLARAAERAEVEAVWIKSIARGGKFLHSDEKAQEAEQQAKTVEEIAEVVKGAPDLLSVLPSLKERLSEELTYGSLLQRLNPRDFGKKPWHGIPHELPQRSFDNE